MNIGFKIIDGKVIVRNEHYREKEREFTNNIKDILECENDIEVIEELIDKEQSYIETSKRNLKTLGLSKLLCSVLWGMTAILNTLTGNFVLAIMNALCCAIWGLNTHVAVKPEKIKIKNSENVIAVLQEQLKERKENLKELNKNKENDALYIEEENELSTSEVIDKLKKKLEIVETYRVMRKFYIELLKDGLLDSYFNLGHDEEEIAFIKALIRLDLGDERFNKLENNKAKQKTL